MHPESQGEPRWVDASGVRPRGTHANFTPNLGVKSAAFRGGTRGTGGGSEVPVWLRTGLELTLLGPPSDFSLGRAGE